MEDAERNLRELVLRDLEELVARIGLEDFDERLVVVASRGEPAAFDDTLDLAPQHRDLPWARAVGRVRKEPEEAALAANGARVVESLHPDVVEVGGPVDRCARVRFRDVENVRSPG